MSIPDPPILFIQKIIQKTHKPTRIQKKKKKRQALCCPRLNLTQDSETHCEMNRVQNQILKNHKEINNK